MSSPGPPVSGGRAPGPRAGDREGEAGATILGEPETSTPAGVNHAREGGPAKASRAVGAEVQALFGRGDENIRLIEEDLKVRLVLRDGQLTVSGSPEGVGAAQAVVEELAVLVRTGRPVGRQEVQLALRHVAPTDRDAFRGVLGELIEVSSRKFPSRSTVSSGVPGVARLPGSALRSVTRPEKGAASVA